MRFWTSPDAPDAPGALPAELPLPHDEGIFALSVEEDGSTRMAWMSEELERIVGAPVHEYVAQGRYHAFTDEEDAARITELERRLAAGELTRGDIEVTWRAGGAERELQVALHTARDPGTGRVGRIFGTVRDVSALRRAERALRAAEEQLRSVLDTVQVGVIVQDADARMFLCNQQALDLVGKTEAHLMGKVSSDDASPLFREDGSLLPGPERPGARAIATRAPVRDAVVGVRRGDDGQMTWVLVNAVPTLTADGQVRHVVTSFIDLTPRRRAEEALRESEERFRAAFQLSGSGMVLADLDARLLQVNEAFCRMLGRSREKLLGVSVLELTHPEDREACLSCLRRLVAGEIRSCQMEKRYVDPGGRVIWSLASLTLVRDGEGRPAYFVAQIQDISARKSAEEEGARLAEQLRQAQTMEALGRLAGGVAHDFNGVLAAIQINLDLLQPAVAGERRALSCVAEIRSAAQRGADLVQQILTFSRLSHARRAPVRLGKVVREALRMLRATLPPSITLEERLPADDAIPPVLADPTQMHQVVVNLGTNAWHAMECGGGTLTVELAAVTADAAIARSVPGLREGPSVRIRVADTGAGMDEPTRQRMFEPFFTTKPAGKGTGLGLAVVHGVVQTHEGAIQVQSAPGQGTTVDVYLPALGNEAAPR